MVEDIRKGEAKCVECHTGEKVHPRAFAHGGNGRPPAKAAAEKEEQP
jgi:cytochrome c-type protein NapC